MTKDEKIKEAYGEYWDRVKDFVDKNGWTEYPKLGSSKLLIDFGGEYGVMPDQFFCRPSSLKGIETNNGWIKIESEKDLPKEKGLYWVFCRGEVQTKSFLKSYYDIHLWIDNVRYYQLIQKPEPPLF